MRKPSFCGGRWTKTAADVDVEWEPLGPEFPEADEHPAGAFTLLLRDVLFEVLPDEVHEQPGRLVADLARRRRRLGGSVALGIGD